MKNIEILLEVETELKRFTSKLNLAIEEQKDVKDNQWSFSRKNYAAAKRAALDLKNELTKLTQDSKYKYSQ